MSTCRMQIKDSKGIAGFFAKVRKVVDFLCFSWKMVTVVCTAVTVLTDILSVASRNNKSWRSEDLNIYPNLQV